MAPEAFCHAPSASKNIQETGTWRGIKSPCEFDDLGQATRRMMALSPALSKGFAPGRIIGGRYELTQVLGEGGMGVVWEARHVTTRAIVALKFLKEENQDRARRLFREARISAQLRHPAIVRVSDVFLDESEAESYAVLVMERLHGMALSERLQQGPLRKAEALAMIVPIVEALAAAHEAGVVHRDLKPANIYLLNGDPTQPRLLDFGIAKARTMDLVGTLDGNTQTGAIVGTPHYMSPEQIFGEADLDARADIWALGVILYECLAGARPFEGDSFGQLIKKITMADAPILPESVAGSRVSSLLGRMLARDRETRPLDCRTLLVDVQACNATPLAVKAEARKPSRRIATVLAALVAGLVALAASIAWVPKPATLRVVPLHVSAAQAETIPTVHVEQTAPTVQSAPPVITTTRPVNAPERAAKSDHRPETPPATALPGAVHAKSPY
jgi:eukaryotic-like serine/threonine-protein kinase